MTGSGLQWHKNYLYDGMFETWQQLLKLIAMDKLLQLTDRQPCAPTTVQNLAVQIDEQMSFDVQVRSCVKTCYYHLYHIRQIKRYVDDDAVCCLVHSFITSRLGYYNSLYAICNKSTCQ